MGEDTFNIIATDNITLIPDLGTGGSDTLVVASTAKGLIETVNNSYKASERSKNDLSLADVVLNADSSVNVDMSM